MKRVLIAGCVALQLAPFQSALVAQDAAHVPRFDYSDSLGCGDVFFHARNNAQTEILRIQVDVAQLPRSASEHVFDLMKLPPGVVVDITLYGRRQINRPNCDDVIVNEVGAPPNPPEVWLPTAGRLEIVRGPRGVRPEQPWLFKATIRLSGARFRGPGGQVVEMSTPFTWEGFVGWVPG